MTDYLIRRALAGADPGEPASRLRLGRMAGLTGIACNLLLALGKLLAGLAVGSVAIIADAANNFSDSASSIVTLAGFRLASRPADKDHPYGHARYEYLAGLGVAAIILVLGLELAVTSVKKIFSPQPVTADGITVAVLAASIALKFWMARFYRKAGSLIHSQVLLASSADSRGDVLATSGVLLSVAVQLLLGWNIDGIMGLIVALFILKSGFEAARDTISPLLGRQADSETVEQLSQLVLSHENVLGIHDLLIHDYGPGQCFASVHAEVSADRNTLETHDLLDDIEDDALEQLNIHLVIHCDPVITDDPRWNAIREAVSKAAAELHPSISVHDFHMMNHDGKTLLGFDLEVPYDLDLPADNLEARLNTRLKELGVEYPAVIHIDGKA